MSLNHLSEASSEPRKSFTTRALFLSLVLAALTACDKPSAPVAAPEAPVQKAPTGRLVEPLVGTTVEQRRALVQEVMQKTLGTTGGDFYSREFPFTQEDLKEGTLAQVDVGFGPGRGIHIVTAKQKDGKTYRHEMVDANNDGDVDFSHRMLSWPVQRNDMSPPMMHSEINTIIDPEVQDYFATALQTSLDAFGQEEKLQPKK